MVLLRNLSLTWDKESSISTIVNLFSSRERSIQTQIKTNMECLVYGMVSGRGGGLVEVGTRAYCWGGAGMFRLIQKMCCFFCFVLFCSFLFESTEVSWFCFSSRLVFLFLLVCCHAYALFYKLNIPFYMKFHFMF